jgi:hypothetical protein
VPATSAVLIAFFSSFLLQPLTVLMKQTRQLVCAIKQSIHLDVYGHSSSPCTWVEGWIGIYTLSNALDEFFFIEVSSFYVLFAENSAK